ncbi:uncharacterized protein LOC110037095 [Phalaenopsis equestris]|uniref:uncharacterized protein LOC110037095 n=1 Tax=Phalaenopsis equestris TaxID=78828 RepID=UPI0009E2FBC3|nr:uncharacterized protein LOC110037095 [Phalaenopsis equestris]
MWSTHPQIVNCVTSNWRGSDLPNPLVKLSLIHINLSKSLRKWGWDTFGNVFSKVTATEKDVEELEFAIQNGNADNAILLTAQTCLNTAIEHQELLLKQKASINIFTEGDRNTKFYHSYISYKRRCNAIHYIQNVEGCLLNNNASNAMDAVKFYQTLLNSTLGLNTNIAINFFTKDFEFNNSLKLSEHPFKTKIWNALSTIEISKAAGPNGYTVDSYKTSWYIIKLDVTKAIISFFNGNNLLSYFKNSSFVLITKNDLHKT